MGQGKAKVGLFFGSFNPVHLGHLHIGEYFHQHHNLDEVWYVLSPQSPFKKATDLAPAMIRKRMLEVALSPYPNFRLIDDEMNRPPPHYTYHTLRELQQKNPNHEFMIIMGEDNTLTLDQWYRGKWIQEHFKVLSYPRRNINPQNNHDINSLRDTKSSKLNMPYIDISAQKIREKIKKGIPVSNWVSDDVEKIIRKEELYLT